MKKSLFLLFSICCLSMPAWAQRIIVLTPDVAEIVAELGAADEVVAVHTHNNHEAYRSKPTIGFYRSLSPEPIVKHKPDLVVGSFMALPPTIYAHLTQIGLKAENVNPKQVSLLSYIDGIKRLGELLGKQAQAKQLEEKFKQAVKQQPATGKRYLVSYDGNWVFGRNTAVDSLIKLAGGINAAASLEGLKPLTREAWVAAKPDVIIVAKHNERVTGGVEKLAARPELAGSPAARNGKIVFWDINDFSYFGLHTPDNIQRLHRLAK